MLDSVLDHIDACSLSAGLPPAVWMMNRVVEYHDDGDSISDGEWPPIPPA